jgi:hypothetical protein
MCELQYKLAFSLLGLSIRDLFWFGSRSLWFSSRLLWQFKVASVWFGFVQDSLLWFSSRLLWWFKVASVWFGLVWFGLVWFGSRYLQFGSRLLWQFKVASVWFSLVQGCFSLVWFGSRLFQLFKVALAVQGCFIGARSCRWFKVASVWFVSRLFVSVQEFFGLVQGCFYGSRSSQWLVWFLWFHLVQGCLTSNTHVSAFQGRQLLLFQLGVLLWGKRDL